MWQKLSAYSIALALVALVLAACAPEPGSTGQEISQSPTATSFVTPSPSSSPSAEESPSATPSPSDARDEVIVTFVTLDVVGDVLEATGMVTGVVEDGGSCTLLLTREGETLEARASGSAGPVSTYCGLMTLSVDDLERGDWSAIIEYSSVAYYGSSGSQIVTVQ